MTKHKEAILYIFSAGVYNKDQQQLDSAKVLEELVDRNTPMEIRKTFIGEPTAYEFDACTCPRCGKDYEINNYCPNCGQRLTEKKR